MGMKQKSVVLAEDDPVLRKLYLHVLMLNGYEVRAAGDGPELERLVDEREPALVILDVMMPRKDGLAVCRDLRRKIGNDMPILFLTALDDLDTLQKCSDAGGSDYLVKDGSPDSLIQRVDYWVRLRAGLVPEDERRPDLSNFVGVAASA